MNESERLKYVRKSLNLKQGDFAKRISTTQGHISDIENGRKSLSDRTIKIISLEFNINDEWLRTGVGEPFFKILEEDEIASYCAEICLGKEPLIAKAIMEYMHLDEYEKKVIEKLLSKIFDKYQ